MRSNTFDDIDRLFDRMHRFTGFDDARSRENTPAWGGEGEMRLDLSEHDDDLVVVADLPGFDREEIDLSVRGDRLTIAASHEETEENDEEQYLRRERRATAVRRSIDLPVAVDADGAGAEYQNGVLTVTLPKMVEDEGRRIDID